MTKCLVIVMWLYLFTLIKGNNDKIIECIYHEFAQEYNLEVFLESGDVFSFYEPIDQKLQFTWTSSNVSVSRLYNQIVSYQTLSLNNVQLNATEYKKVIQLNTDVNSGVNFYFFHISTYGTSIKESGGFGFAYKFTDYKYSLIHQLRQQNMITRLQYAVLPKKTNKGSVYLGGLPEELVEGVTVSKCIVNFDHITWGCAMTHVIFGDMNTTKAIGSLPSYSNSYYAYFQMGIRRILAPKLFMDYLAQTALATQIRTKKCIYENVIICAINTIQYIPHFNFVFEGRLGLIFDWNYLFDCTGVFCTLLIEANEKGNEWVLGTNFIRKYGILFDYEDHSIAFYTKRDFIILNDGALTQIGHNDDDNFLSNIKFLYYIITVLLIAVSVFLVWIKHSYLKHH